MSTPHTPGPWKFRKDSETSEGEIVNHSGFLIATMKTHSFGDFIEEDSANARLIAAAPELLAACEQMLKLQAMREAGTMPKLSDWENAHYDARKAIIKAKGEL